MIKYQPMKKSVIFLPLTLVLMGACAPVVANRGNIVEDDRLSQIEVGVSDQAAVESALGPPTMVGTFDPNSWYYSGARTKRTAFFDPKVSYARTLHIAFDESGRVKEITEIDPESGKDIDPVTRKTKTGGHDMNVIEQMIDNLSRPGLPGALGKRR
jgi:outer membrane protein assembly factor BamE (lipoprotein component of BamABCDE complex)